jgi:hypothetical protein
VIRYIYPKSEWIARSHAAKSVFISHSSKDDAIVRELRHALEGIGIEVWADSERLSGGDPLAPKIQQAIKKADYQIAIISMNGLNSEWVQREIEHAESAGRGIVPLMLPGIGPVAMRRLFRQELVGIPLKNGPGAVQERFPTS